MHGAPRRRALDALPQAVQLEVGVDGRTLPAGVVKLAIDLRGTALGDEGDAARNVGELFDQGLALGCGGTVVLEDRLSHDLGDIGGVRARLRDRGARGLPVDDARPAAEGLQVLAADLAEGGRLGEPRLETVGLARGELAHDRVDLVGGAGRLGQDAQPLGQRRGVGHQPLSV